MTLQTTSPASEAHLDPDDWTKFRHTAHRMLDDSLDYLEKVRDRPLWRPMPVDVQRRFQEPVPDQSRPLEDVYRQFQETVLPYNMGNVHPRFWAWVIGAGTPVGVLAELLAATLNPNAGGGDHVAAHVEHQVLSWCASMLRFSDEECGGLLVSGASMANLIGLAVARHARSGADMRQAGMSQDARRLIVYGSTETHSSVQKSCELLGFGAIGYRQLPVDEAFELDVGALAAALDRDRADGHVPCAVVANVGTVNTGACDDVEAIADLCEASGCWLHVDGAFGALARLCPELEGLTAGVERADSIAFDLHKWMSIPYDAACVLVRDRRVHEEAFSLTPEYLVRAERGLAGGDFWPSEFGPQLSRGFRALKVWMSFKTHGLDSYREVIRKNIAQTALLARLVEESPRLQMTAPAPLNIACFRFCCDPPERADEVNREIVMQLQEAGIAAPSLTRLHDRTVIRVANVNHRTSRSDIELLVREVTRLGEEISSGSAD